ncbi:MAG: hypothetical protein IAE92_05200, partial [Burkholderiaceae bacterium]|nr:hypothetical protein [Burkholderiaceae bacterium]
MLLARLWRSSLKGLVPVSSAFPTGFSGDIDDLPIDRQVAQLRIPPHSIEAESSVLGGLLLD